MAVIQRNIVIGAGGACFTTTDQTFDSQDVTSIHVTVFLILQVVTDFRIFFVDNLVFAVVEDLIEAVDEMQEADYFFIAYGNVTGGFVCHMHVMFLLYQAADGATHGYNVIIRMRRKHNDALGIWLRAFGTIGVVCIRFSTRPAGDGVLQIVENLDIYIICRTVKGKQFA